MAENYPTSIDTTSNMPHHSAGQVIPSAGWNDMVDAILALENKLGLFTANGLPNTVATFGMAGTLFTQVGQSRWYCERPYTLVAVRMSLGTAGSGGGTKIQVNTGSQNQNPATTPFTPIFSASAPDDRPTIGAGNFRSNTTILTGTTPLAVALATGDFFTVDVAQVTAPAADLTVQLILTPA